VVRLTVDLLAGVDSKRLGLRPLSADLLALRRQLVQVDVDDFRTISPKGERHRVAAARRI